MFTVLARIDSPNILFELLEGELPRPVHYGAVSPDPILTTVRVPPGYRMEARVGARSLDLRRELGRSFLLPPNYEFEAEATGGTVRAAQCVFRDWRVISDGIFPSGQRLNKHQLSRALDLRNPMINILMGRLTEEAIHPGYGSMVVARSIANLLLIECGREIFEGQTDFSNVPRELSSDELSLVDQLLGNTEETPSLADLASVCGLEVNSFRRSFRRSTGRTVTQHISEWRMQRAEGLLAQGDLPLKAIAYQLGFNSPAYFSTTFRKRHGIPPGEFRLRYKGTSPDDKR
jgi:AraC family transcriptional regulator